VHGEARIPPSPLGGQLRGWRWWLPADLRAGAVVPGFDGRGALDYISDLVGGKIDRRAAPG